MPSTVSALFRENFKTYISLIHANYLDHSPYSCSWQWRNVFASIIIAVMAKEENTGGQRMGQVVCVELTALAAFLDFNKQEFHQPAEDWICESRTCARSLSRPP